jgi:hypothetical protein
MAWLLTATSGTTAPGTLGSDTGRTLPPVVALRRTACWPVLLADVDPAAITVSPGATVAKGVPESLTVVPSDPVGRQVVPVPVLV